MRGDRSLLLLVGSIKVQFRHYHKHLLHLSWLSVSLHDDFLNSRYQTEAGYSYS